MAVELARVLREAAAERRIDPQAPDSGTVAVSMSLREVVDLHGHGSGAVMLMVMSLLSVLPVAGAGTVLSFGLWMLALAWMAGRDAVALPRRVGAVTLRGRWVAHGLELLAMTYETAGRWLRPRWHALVHPRLRLWWGLWIALMAGIIFLPLPFGNVLPSMSLIALSLGWMFRDGLALLVSGAFGAGAILYLITLWQVVEHLLRSWI
ncbi:hypothetical protein A9O67_03695 [Tepidimonas fonticaldi]|uniref:Exopolysaccharide synthesis, ExoD n=1 Tax=Tepidimonas fonticaldi TaxID=1101373 RepID=A0A1A6DTI3_9BURK|nr:exopolysaccharide biosynthesis protein [Tepidimonas fonticaldi]OBS30173.1 hypothetical protein A9O67_03695 [Tepidimonas fonticaldi]